MFIDLDQRMETTSWVIGLERLPLVHNIVVVISSVTICVLSERELGRKQVGLTYLDTLRMTQTPGVGRTLG